ncbi:MAG: farnesyl diphosphate synthase [Pseudomonadota bacterium]
MPNDALFDIEREQTQINRYLDAHTNTLKAAHQPLSNTLSDAMKYAVMNGGKRIRPLLVIASAKTIDPNVSYDVLNPLAAAVEYIHCYSLVHDDLPAMDDDDLRRGKPTCHKQFDEATAILVGDALQTEAFQQLLNAPVDAQIKVELLTQLSTASGAHGLVAGQAIDLAATNRRIDIHQLQGMHRLKTGALIKASVLLGAIATGATTTQQAHLNDFSDAIGLAFQVLDDILDIESTTEELGKTQGSDRENNKSTYPSLLGMSEAKAHLNTLSQTAFERIALLSDHVEPLKTLTHFIIERRH